MFKYISQNRFQTVLKVKEGDKIAEYPIPPFGFITLAKDIKDCPKGILKVAVGVATTKKTTTTEEIGE